MQRHLPFADAALAARIERAECSFVASAAEGRRARQPEADTLVEWLAGGLAVFAGPGSPLNKVCGLGFGEEPADADLERLERAFGERGEPLRVELASLADPTLPPRLARRGYVLQGFENVLALGLEDYRPPVTAPGIAVATSPDQDFDEWLGLIVDGFAVPDDPLSAHESYPREVLEEVIGALADADGFTRWLARREGRSAGAASLRLAGDLAQLCGAATLPLHRRNGVQNALLATRLAHAREAGCSLAVVTTQPGSRSQQNVERQGFALLYTRVVLVR